MNERMNEAESFLNIETNEWNDKCMNVWLREWQNTNVTISYYTIEQIWDDI